MKNHIDLSLDTQFDRNKAISEIKKNLSNDAVLSSIERSVKKMQAELSDSSRTNSSTKILQYLRKNPDALINAGREISYK